MDKRRETQILKATIWFFFNFYEGTVRRKESAINAVINHEKLSDVTESNYRERIMEIQEECPLMRTRGAEHTREVCDFMLEGYCDFSQIFSIVGIPKLTTELAMMNRGAFKGSIKNGALKHEEELLMLMRLWRGRIVRMKPPKSTKKGYKILDHD